MERPPEVVGMPSYDATSPYRRASVSPPRAPVDLTGTWVMESRETEREELTTYPISITHNTTTQDLTGTAEVSGSHFAVKGSYDNNWATFNLHWGAGFVSSVKVERQLSGILAGSYLNNYNQSRGSARLKRAGQSMGEIRPGAEVVDTVTSKSAVIESKYEGDSYVLEGSWWLVDVDGVRRLRTEAEICPKVIGASPPRAFSQRVRSKSPMRQSPARQTPDDRQMVIALEQKLADSNMRAEALAHQLRAERLRSSSPTPTPIGVLPPAVRPVSPLLSSYALAAAAAVATPPPAVSPAAVAHLPSPITALRQEPPMRALPMPLSPVEDPHRVHRALGLESPAYSRGRDVQVGSVSTPGLSPPAPIGREGSLGRVRPDMSPPPPFVRENSPPIGSLPPPSAVTRDHLVPLGNQVQAVHTPVHVVRQTTPEAGGGGGGGGGGEGVETRRTTQRSVSKEPQRSSPPCRPSMRSPCSPGSAAAPMLKGSELTSPKAAFSRTSSHASLPKQAAVPPSPSPVLNRAPVSAPVSAPASAASTPILAAGTPTTIASIRAAVHGEVSPVTVPETVPTPTEVVELPTTTTETRTAEPTQPAQPQKENEEKALKEAAQKAEDEAAAEKERAAREAEKQQQEAELEKQRAEQEKEKEREAAAAKAASDAAAAATAAAAAAAEEEQKKAAEEELASAAASAASASAAAAIKAEEESAKEAKEAAEQAEKEATEKAEKEKADQEAKDKAERDAKEKEAKDKADQEAKEKAEREAKEKEAAAAKAAEAEQKAKEEAAAKEAQEKVDAIKALVSLRKFDGWEECYDPSTSRVRYYRDGSGYDMVLDNILETGTIDVDAIAASLIEKKVYSKANKDDKVYFYHKASRTSVKKLTDVVEENAALASKELAAALTQNPPKEGEKTATTPFSPAPVAFDAAFTTIFDELNTRAPPTKKKK